MHTHTYTHIIKANVFTYMIIIHTYHHTHVVLQEEISMLENVVFSMVHIHTRSSRLLAPLLSGLTANIVMYLSREVVSFPCVCLQRSGDSEPQQYCAWASPCCMSVNEGDECCMRPLKRTPPNEVAFPVLAAVECALGHTKL